MHGTKPEGDDHFWVRWMPTPTEQATPALILLHKSQMAEVPIHSHWTRTDTDRAVPIGVHPSPVFARVNDSRWIVDCDFCGGAQLASVNDRRFFCIDCLNCQSDGVWRPVVWPEAPDEIQEVLLQRPHPRTRHWRHGETVADLHRENAQHLGAQ